MVARRTFRSGAVTSGWTRTKSNSEQLVSYSFDGAGAHALGREGRTRNAWKGRTRLRKRTRGKGEMFGSAPAQTRGHHLAELTAHGTARALLFFF